MYVSLELLIVGLSRESIAPVVEALDGEQMMRLVPYVIRQGQLMLPEYMRPAPDALVFCIDPGSEQAIWETVERIPTPRPPLFVACPGNDMALLRTAMRLGVRDVFSLPLNVDDFSFAVSRVVREDRDRRGETGSRLISFMNTKGGSGASLIAANVALAMATQGRFGRRLLLVDFDFQFGGLPTYLSLVARDGLIKAMEFVDTLDEAALQGYVQRHESGLHLLASAMDEIIVPEDISAERTEKLLGVIDGPYEDILVDLPHRIDASTAAILEHADLVALVAQQTVAHLHDTKRLIFLLRDRLGIALERVLLIVNRFDKKAEIRLEDFFEIFPGVGIRTIPGDYIRASESINLGIPICESAPRSPLGRSLTELAEGFDQPATLSTTGDEPRPRLLSWLRRGAGAPMGH